MNTANATTVIVPAPTVDALEVKVKGILAGMLPDLRLLEMSQLMAAYDADTLRYPELSDDEVKRQLYAAWIEAKRM